MKEQTRMYREQLMRDGWLLNLRNNSKDSRRTPDQIRQSLSDRAKHLETKWRWMAEAADTKTQKRYCKAMLDMIAQDRCKRSYS